MPTHEIFQKPFKVDLQFEDAPTPENYRTWPGGAELGKTMKVWKVQNKKFSEVDPGLVSDPYGFTDSPDAEVISSGLNSKGPTSVALGRHGNFFLWGFSGQPSDMTPEGRKCFANVICYIKKFEGQKPIVHRDSQDRQWALVYAGYLKHISSDDFLKQLFPEDLRDRFGKDPEKYISYYKENLEFLHAADNHIVVDEEVKSLGLSNRKVELLDKCVAMLEQGEQPELALKLLKRYTTETCEDAKAWRSWLDENRGQLFFTDVGGYKFLVTPKGMKASAPPVQTAGGS